MSTGYSAVFNGEHSFSASFSSFRNGSANGIATGIPPPPRSFPPAAPAASPARVAATSVVVTTLQQLVAAFADTSVADIVLANNIQMRGSELALTGPGRSLSLRAAPGACAPYLSASGRNVSGGRWCTLDAAGASRLFTISGGAALHLEALALVGGSALQGGCVLAAGDTSSVTASDCLFADCTALGDGGAALALAGARITLLAGSSAVNCTAQHADGGALAALHGSTVALLDTASVAGCHAQNGGGVAAIHNSSVVLAGGAAVSNCTAEGQAGGVAAAFYSTATLQRASIQVGRDPLPFK